MREILFKAKRVDNGEWIEGHFFYDCDIDDCGARIPTIVTGTAIAGNFHAINLETVCQFTGLKDKNGAMIFEGDILRFEPKTEWDKKNYSSFEVFYHDNDSADGHVGFQINRTRFWGSLCGGHVPDFLPRNTAEMTIIGNIHDGGRND